MSALDTHMRAAADGIHRSVDSLRFVDPEARPVERFRRFEYARRRSQRAMTIVVALVIAAVAIGGAIRALTRSTAPTPANMIDRSNVSELKPSWGAQGIRAEAPVTDGHLVFVASQGGGGKLEAFPTSCGTARTCDPVWVGDVGAGAATPVVSGGIVYAVENHRDPSGEGRLYAFPADCVTGEATCAPLWSARSGAVANPEMSPVVAGGMVFTASSLGTVSAFPVGCRTDGGTCEPAWTADVGGRPAGAMAASGDSLYVGANDVLIAFPLECGAPVCRPRWSRPMGGFILGIDTAGVRVFVGVGHEPNVLRTSMYALPVDCAGGCDPLWTARTNCCAAPTASGGVVYVTDEIDGLYAFKAACRSDGGECAPLWTGAPPSPGPLRLGSARPVISGGVVFVGGANDRVYAYPTNCVDTCAELWTGNVAPASPSDRAFVGVAVADGRVYASTERGLHTFSLEPTAPARPGSPSAVSRLLYVAILLGFAVMFVARRRHLN